MMLKNFSFDRTAIFSYNVLCSFGCSGVFPFFLPWAAALPVSDRKWVFSVHACVVFARSSFSRHPQKNCHFLPWRRNRYVFGVAIPFMSGQEKPMNDFLHSLRSNKDRQDRRFDRSRRQYSNPQYKGPERRYDKDGRRNIDRPERQQASTELVSDVIPAIKGLLEEIAGHQGRLVAAQESLAVAEERKADALESLAVYLKAIIEGEVSGQEDDDDQGFDAGESVAHASKRTRAVAATPAPVLSNREQVINTIVTMRNQGATYNEIAQHLETEKVATFSGKGAWHAQTIHRVCRQNGTH
jgi:hypothetical protein